MKFKGKLKGADINAMNEDKKISNKEKLRMACYLTMLIILQIGFIFISDSITSWCIKSTVTLFVWASGIMELEEIIDKKTVKSTDKNS